jgi:hypothetical protein
MAAVSLMGWARKDGYAPRLLDFGRIILVISSHEEVALKASPLPIGTTVE